MDGIMLCTGIELTILCVAWSLKSLDDLNSKARSEVRILSVGLLSTSPARVAEDIDVRSPDRKAMEAQVFLALSYPHVICRTTFIADLREDLEKEFVVEAGSHTDWLWIDCHIAHVGNAMKRLAPPVESLDAEMRNCLRHIHHDLCLFFERHARHDVNCSLMRRKRWILIRISLCYSQ